MKKKKIKRKKQDTLHVHPERRPDFHPSVITFGKTPLNYVIIPLVCVCKYRKSCPTRGTRRCLSLFLKNKKTKYERDTARILTRF